jgi:fructokinase
VRIGLDLGGTKIEVAVLAGDGRIVLRRRISSPQGDYAATVEVLANLVLSCEAEVGATCTVGVGIPGAVSPVTGLVKNANSTWLIGKPLEKDLSARVGRPVRVANDANCFALSEAVDGAGAGAETVFGVILGTGVGGGIVVSGRLVVGANALSGEWGHNPLPGMRGGTGPDAEWPGPPCYCGRSGCIETFLSGPGLARDYHAHTGSHLAAPAIVARADGGDAEAASCLARYEDRLARGLASIINVLDPDVIVLGGGLSNVSRLYENVPRLWSRHVFSDAVITKLLPPAHGDSSGVRGAAWLWPDDV